MRKMGKKCLSLWIPHSSTRFSVRPVKHRKVEQKKSCNSVNFCQKRHHPQTETLTIAILKSAVLGAWPTFDLKNLWEILGLPSHCVFQKNPNGKSTTKRETLLCPIFFGGSLNTSMNHIE